MPRNRCVRFLALAGTWLVLQAGSTANANADGTPPTAAIPGPGVPARSLVPSRQGTAARSTESSAGWWLGSVGIAGALAVFGGVSLASKRFLPSRDSGPIQVVGRSALSTKHSVYLLRVGTRVMIVGAGPQGAPSNLGEVTDPAELARLVPQWGTRPSTVVLPPTAPTRPSSSGFDRRIGDDE